MTLDLLGDEIQMTSSRSLIDPLYGFADWWRPYPPDRRVEKKKCIKLYIQKGCCNYATLMLQHIEYLKTTEQWKRGVVPLTTTYLNQERWVDFEPPAPKPAQKTWLEEYSEHEKHCTKPSAEIRAKMAQLRKQG